jgi:hypothetical protein
MSMLTDRRDTCVLACALVTAALYVASCAPPPEPPVVVVASESEAAEHEDLDESPYPFTEDPADDPMMAEVARATGRTFAAIDARPFRIVVQGTAQRAETIARGLIARVDVRFRRQFFREGPKDNIRIVLFRGAEPYRAGAEALSGEAPDTPYGYYSDDLGAIVMDFNTGGGTLVHELVHAYAETDFPDIPAWLNEGLGSLFEQASFPGERIEGLPNWRLPGLQETLREEPAGTTGILAAVLATTAWQFYGQDSGTNYAVARYLCFDLQQMGLLEQFYKTFRDGDGADPTGRAVLESALGRTLEEYEPEWRERTLKLRYR